MNGITGISGMAPCKINFASMILLFEFCYHCVQQILAFTEYPIKWTGEVRRGYCKYILYEQIKDKPNQL